MQKRIDLFLERWTKLTNELLELILIPLGGSQYFGSMAIKQFENLPSSIFSLYSGNPYFLQNNLHHYFSHFFRIIHIILFIFTFSCVKFCLFLYYFKVFSFITFLGVWISSFLNRASQMLDYFLRLFFAFSLIDFCLYYFLSPAILTFLLPHLIKLHLF